MAKAKTPAVIDTSAGTNAYTLAEQHKTELDPRLPAGTMANLVEDLTTLGAPPVPTPPAQPPPPNQTPPPTLAQAMSAAVTLITALHQAIRGAQPSGAVRKAYGASSKTPSKEAEAVIADGNKIVTQAKANPTEALSLGILPGDVAALTQALADLTAAETLAKGKSAIPGGTTGKQRHAAEVRMHQAVARIAGAGALAFATNPTVRAQFEALKPMKNA